MVTCISHSTEDTIRIGSNWGGSAQAGWLIGLQGDLGSGKTQLVKGIAQGLRTPAKVHSPTYTLINLYEGGRLPLYHLDLYRLNGINELFSAGLEEYLWNPPGVTVVEWIERFLGDAPAPQNLPVCPQGNFRFVTIETINETSRRIGYEDFGP